MNLPKYVLTCAEHKNKLDPSMSLFADPLLSRSFIYKMLKMSGMKVPFVGRSRRELSRLSRLIGENTRVLQSVKSET
jgi:hypothetical protein